MIDPESLGAEVGGVLQIEGDFIVQRAVEIGEGDVRQELAALRR